MKNNMRILYIILAFLFVATGFVVYNAAFRSGAKPPVAEVEPTPEIMPEVDASVLVDVVKSSAKASTVVIEVTGLDGKYASVGYELTYDSKGLIKGLDSGSIPIDVAGKDTFEKEVYLGTCSRNVCTPDPGVTSVDLVLTFTDASGKRSQFTKSYEL